MANPKLVPLKQWYCDTCNGIIKRADHGYLEWRTKEVGSGKNRRYVNFGYRIVHHALYSPYRESRGRDGCYYPNAERGGDLDLPEFLGSVGLIHAANWIDLGSAWDREYPGPKIESLREWAFIFRRLHLPYFEEARFYLDQAKSGAQFGDSNQLSFYLPDTLKEIIQYYTEEP